MTFCKAVNILQSILNLIFIVNKYLYSSLKLQSSFHLATTDTSQSFDKKLEYFSQIEVKRFWFEG